MRSGLGHGSTVTKRLARTHSRQGTASAVPQKNIKLEPALAAEGAFEHVLADGNDRIELDLPIVRKEHVA
jgi:hypothetical protein